MKKIGLIGGTSPESTLLYYRHLIELSRKALPKNVYPEILIYSVNFDFVVSNMRSGKVEKVVEEFNEILKLFESAGVEIASLTANTMHLLFDKLDTSIKLVHIVDSVLKRAIEKGYKRLILFGTKRTMESDLYPSRLRKHGIEVVIPNDEDREKIDRIIFEITASGVNEELKERAIDLARKYANFGDAIILGCTELPLVLNNKGFEVIDTVRVHAEDIFREAVKV
jgi:aspartate racemase